MAGNSEIPSAAAAASSSSSVTAVKVKLAVAESMVGEAVGFYTAAFGAEVMKLTKETKRKPGQELPRLLSAEIMIGSEVILISGEIDDAAPAVRKEGAFMLEVEGGYFQVGMMKAVVAGAIQEGLIEEIEGGRVASKLRDPFGFGWILVSTPPPQPPQPDDAGSECS